MYTPLEQTRGAHWDAATSTHYFSPTLLAFLILRFLPLFGAFLGVEGVNETGE
jgi:hypothetical protein